MIYKKYFILGVVYLMWGWYMVLPNDGVKVVFCDVGQGDAAIVVSGNFEMLIDTGPVKGNVEKCLDANMPLGDKTLEIVLLSHWDSDHTGALDNLKKYYQINRIFGLGDVFEGDVIEGKGFVFEVLFPNIGLQERVNDSIVGILRYDDKNILFTGDIDELVENSILDNVKLPIDVVKVSHHGSVTGNSVKWLQKINANQAIISVGKNNYGHPSSEVLNRVLGVGTSIYRTDENGSLVVN